MWAYGRHDLGLPTKEFWGLDIIEFRALMERRRANLRELHQITSAVYNSTRASKDDKVWTPLDFVPERAFTGTAITFEETDEEYAARLAELHKSELMAFTVARMRNSAN